ncbi:MAG TPA: STAS domain-containing protein [Terracidiphilus sp.]|jgi:anti-anti-sigma regulatory factor|nr:STAS domain-containing protein [Terracidiphilus sp.]
MGVISEKGDGFILLRLEGSVDIACGAELKTALLQALQSGGEVRIDAAAATYFDVATMQLLWAAEREAKQRGVTYGCREEFPESIRIAWREAGFDEIRRLDGTSQLSGEGD